MGYLPQHLQVPERKKKWDHRYEELVKNNVFDARSLCDDGRGVTASELLELRDGQGLVNQRLESLLSISVVLGGVFRILFDVKANSGALRSSA